MAKVILKMIKQVEVEKEVEIADELVESLTNCDIRPNYQELKRLTDEEREECVVSYFYGSEVIENEANGN